MTEETNDQELIEQGRFLALMRSNGHIQSRFDAICTHVAATAKTLYDGLEVTAEDVLGLKSARYAAMGIGLDSLDEKDILEGLAQLEPVLRQERQRRLQLGDERARATNLEEVNMMRSDTTAGRAAKIAAARRLGVENPADTEPDSELSHAQKIQVLLTIENRSLRLSKAREWGLA